MTTECVFSMIGGETGLELFATQGQLTKITMPASDGILPSVSGDTVDGNLGKFSDTAGTLEDSGIVAANVQLKDSTLVGTASYVGGSASFAITVTGLTASSKAVVNFTTQANAASVLTSACGTNVINVVATADPGACTVTYVAFKVAQ